MQITHTEFRNRCARNSAFTVHTITRDNNSPHSIKSLTPVVHANSDFGCARLFVVTKYSPRKWRRIYYLDMKHVWHVKPRARVHARLALIDGDASKAKAYAPSARHPRGYHSTGASRGKRLRYCWCALMIGPRQNRPIPGIRLECISLS